MSVTTKKSQVLRCAPNGRNGLLLIQLILSATLCSCTAQSEPSAASKKGSAWKTDAKRPLIQAGDMRDKGLWNDPCVLKEGGSYIMYMTSSVNEPFQPPVLPFRATSKDGIHWKLDPKTPLLNPEGTPFVSLETPSVVRYRDEYHMFFTGIYPPGHMPPMAIGHAVSRDGVSWKVDKDPVITATGTPQDWNGYLVAEPGAVLHNDGISLYFTAVGARPGGQPPQLQTIALAKTLDGRNFSEAKSVLGQSPLYPPKQGYVGYSTPSASLIDEKVHLFFDVAHYEKGADREWHQVALHHAVSSDGESNFVQDSAPIFMRNSLEWTSGEIRSPCVLLDNGELKLWFAGNVALRDLAPLIRRGMKGREFGIGIASIDWQSFLELTR